MPSRAPRIRQSACPGGRGELEARDEGHQAPAGTAFVACISGNAIAAAAPCLSAGLARCSMSLSLKRSLARDIP